MPASLTQSSVMNNQVDEKLRAALQEMDDIMKVSFDGYVPPDEACYTNIKNCCEDLCVHLRQCTNERKALDSLSDETYKLLRSWLDVSGHSSDQSEPNVSPVQINGCNGWSGDETGYSSSNHSSTSSHSKHSDQEAESLKRQIINLQVQVQDGKKKIKEVESCLISTNDKLIKAEERLHKEQVNKTYMESHKLDLMAEVAELRVRLQTVEAEKTDYRERYENVQSQVLELHEKLIAREREIADLRTQITRNGISIRAGHTGNYGSLDREALRMRRKPGEVESLKKAINDLIAAGQEKDRRITELRKAVSTYQRVEEIILQSHGRPQSSGSESCGSTNDKTVRASDNGNYQTNEQARPNALPNATSTPVTDPNSQEPSGVHQNNRINQYSTITTTPTNDKEGQVKRSNSFDAAKFHKIMMPEPEKLTSKTPAPTRKADTRNSAKAVKSVKDEAETDVTSDDEDIPAKDGPKKKKAGFKRFFNKLRKSSSQEGLDEVGHRATAPVISNNFKRGGIRATAGPRLGWGVSQGRTISNNRQEQDGEARTPFHQWDAVQVTNWLIEMGLNMYATECKRWNKTGKQILEASQHEIDKELRICNPLHRKKIHLALEAERSGTKKDQSFYSLRPEWVSKWLDDIGLPQYKDQFYEARVDSRMLNYITVEDLLYMKISNALHHASIRRGIELLRKNKFDLSVLKRRPGPENASNVQATTPTHSQQDVTLWTNHRVMEWLRSIDLSEYVANLRGSGVHGALIMLEPKFTVEHLATILNIPSSKTLLRRHLTAHFINLIGKQVQDEKCEADSGLKLELNTKVKAKKNPFKKNRSSTSDYLCPMVLEPIDAQAEDQRIKEAVAMYKKELNKNHITEVN